MSKVCSSGGYGGATTRRATSKVAPARPEAAMAVPVVKDRRARFAFVIVSAAILAAPAALGATSSRTDPQQDAAKKEAGPGNPAAATNPYRPNRFAGKAGRYYKLVWGVDSLNVKLAESGELVRFTWRVLDPDRAKVLNDNKLKPALIDPQAGVSLVVPVMEKIGQLRQSAQPEAGKSYWMVFSNKGRRVKRGDRVNVVVGQFRADGLVVD